MKISRKIMASNMIIGFLVTVLLSIMILVVVNNFIRDNVFSNMEKELYRIAEFAKYRGTDAIFRDVSILESKSVRRVVTTGHVFIALDSKGALIDNSPYKYPKDVTDEFYKELHNIKSGEYTNMQLGNYPVIIYKNIVTLKEDGKETEIQLIGLVYNYLLYELLFDMMIPVLIALFIVIILSFIVSAVLGKKMTKPVESLIEMTKQIGEKELVTSTIESRDEFQIIGKALEIMSQAINLKDIEAKQFYEHVSHDLKTPLTIISGYAEGVSSGIFEDNAEPLQKIVKQCNNMKSQIEDVIYLSQLETNKQTFEFKETVLEDIISEILDDFEVVFINSDIEVCYQPTRSTLLLLDRDKVIRAVNNIVSNAVKCTTSELKVEIIELANEVKVCFSDDGHGFENEILENPFSGYYASDNVGNGIGLMIVYKIIAEHNGNVNIYNSKKGAVVEFVFNRLY